MSTFQIDPTTLTDEQLTSTLSELRTLQIALMSEQSERRHLAADVITRLQANPGEDYATAKARVLEARKADADSRAAVLAKITTSAGVPEIPLPLLMKAWLWTRARSKGTRWTRLLISAKTRSLPLLPRTPNPHSRTCGLRERAHDPRRACTFTFTTVTLLECPNTVMCERMMEHVWTKIRGRPIRTRLRQTQAPCRRTRRLWLRSPPR